MADNGSRHGLSRRSFMKRFGAGVGMLIIGGSALEACTSSPPSSPSSAPPPPGAPTAAAGAAPQSAGGASQKTPKRGGVLRASSAWTYPTLDPHLSSQGALGGYGLMYDTLVRYEMVDPSGKFELRPGLAESWERKDDKTFIFNLRKGVKFHDGSDFNGEVAKWNLERMVKHPKSNVKEPLAAIQSVDVKDTHVIQVNLNSPAASLLKMLSGGANFGPSIISKAAMDKLGENGFAINPSGTGPMKFDQWIRDDRLIMKKFDGYWANGADGKPLPYLDQFVHRYITDPSVALLEMKAGNLDLIDDVDAQDVAGVKSDSNLVYWELPFAGPIYFIVGFNMENGPFKDIRLRKAALYALNRDAMVKVLGFGIAKPHYYPYWEPGALGYDDTLPRYDFDLDKAKSLVKEAYPSGVGITLSVITRQPEQRIGEMAAEMWNAAGINTKLETLERLAFNDKMFQGKFDAGFWRYATVAVDPDRDSTRVMPKGSSNFSLWNNREAAAAMTAGRSTYDESQRAEQYKKVQKLIYDDAAIGSGYRMPGNKVYRKGLQNFKLQFMFWDLNAAWWDK